MDFRLKRMLLIMFPLILTGAALLVWQAVAYASPQKHLRVVFLHVGQGDSIYIETPHHNRLLIDAGPPDGAGLSALSRVMPFFEKRIDALLMTHPDQDHIGGMPPILDRYAVGALIEPGVTSENQVDDAIMQKAEQKQIPKLLARRGMNIDLGDGVTFHILFPDRDTAGWETNTASVVGKLTHGENTFLLTGDAPDEIERYLISLQQSSGNATELKSDVLKAGHHGSKTSSSLEFVEAIRPLYGIISAGKNNSYGHPHKEALDHLGSVAREILVTFERGDITFLSDGKVLTQK